MNECLVTKLKASVNDSNLQVLGELILAKKDSATPSVNNHYCFIQSTVPITIEILNDGYFCKNNSTEKDETASKIKSFEAGDINLYISIGSKFRIIQRYGITAIRGEAMAANLSDFTYMNGLHTLDLIGDTIEGSIEVLNGYKIQSARLTGTKNKIYGSINGIDFENATSVDLDSKNITGDITTAFGNSINLTNMGIAESGISGSIEELVNAQIAARRSTGTIKIPWVKAVRNVTYKGIALSANSEVPAANDNNAFTWDSNGLITWV